MRPLLKSEVVGCVAALKAKHRQSRQKVAGGTGCVKVSGSFPFPFASLRVEGQDDSRNSEQYRIRVSLKEVVRVRRCDKREFDGSSTRRRRCESGSPVDRHRAALRKMRLFFASLRMTALVWCTPLEISSRCGDLSAAPRSSRGGAPFALVRSRSATSTRAICVLRL